MHSKYSKNIFLCEFQLNTSEIDQLMSISISDSLTFNDILLF